MAAVPVRAMNCIQSFEINCCLTRSEKSSQIVRASQWTASLQPCTPLKSRSCYRRAHMARVAFKGGKSGLSIKNAKYAFARCGVAT